MKANYEDLILEITSTLEEILKVNEMILFHESFDEKDVNAIQNFIRLRSDFLVQLDELMKELYISTLYCYA